MLEDLVTPAPKIVAPEGWSPSVVFDGDGGEITVKPSKEQYDLNMSKQASLNNDGTVSYTVKASTKNGTEGPVKIRFKTN